MISLLREKIGLMIHVVETGRVQVLARESPLRGIDVFPVSDEIRIDQGIRREVVNAVVGRCVLCDGGNFRVPDGYERNAVGAQSEVMANFEL